MAPFTHWDAAVNSPMWLGHIRRRFCIPKKAHIRGDKHPEHMISSVWANICIYSWTYHPHISHMQIYLVHYVLSWNPDNLKASRLVGSILSSERRVGNSHAWLANLGEDMSMSRQHVETMWKLWNSPLMFIEGVTYVIVNGIDFLDQNMFFFRKKKRPFQEF